MSRRAHRAGRERTLRYALVELLITPRCIVQGDHGGVDVLGDLYPIIKDRHHQLALITHGRALSGGERVRLGPADAEPQGQRSPLRMGVTGSGILRDVQPGNADGAAGPSNVHRGVEHRRRCLAPVSATTRLESDRIDPTVASTSATPRICSIWSGNGRLALLAVTASATGHVKRNRYQITHGDELDVAALLDHLSGDFMTQHQA